MSFPGFTLDQLGWRPGYARYLTLKDFEAGYPARVVGVHRHHLSVLGSRGAIAVTLPPLLAVRTKPLIVVGDWVLVDHVTVRVRRLIARHSLVARSAGGGRKRMVAIAANLDTLFVLASCRRDPDPVRLKRQLAMATDARVKPVVLLTESDRHLGVGRHAELVQALAPAVPIVPIEANATASRLAPWLGRGRTVAFVSAAGSSEPGLPGDLRAYAAPPVGGMPTGQAPGRPCATACGMFALHGGAWMIDTPGLRDPDAECGEGGRSGLFERTDAVAAACRRRDCRHDCRHDGDVGCVIAPDLADGPREDRDLAGPRRRQHGAGDV